jgi:hypothetical protein
MPKQIYKIDQFHGGLNSNADPRDISDNELSAATDIMVDQLGKIRSLGGSDAHASSARANVITPGYGLYAWNHDRVDGHFSGAGTDDPETGENYLAFSDANTDGIVSIYAFSDNTWGNPITGMTNNTGGTRKDVFYAIDGALRVCDSRFTTTNTSKWYGYVDREYMYNSGSTVTVDQWVLESQYISRPGANSGWDDAISASTTSAAHTHTVSGAGSGGIGALLTSDGTQEYFQAENVLNDGAGDAVSNIYTMDITVRVQYDGVDDSHWGYTLTAGDASNSTTFVASPSSKQTSVVSEGSVDDTNVIEDTVHTFTFAVGDTVQGTGSTAGARASLAVPILGSNVDSIGIIKVVITEGSTSGSAHDGVDGNDIDTNEVYIEAEFEATTGSTGWDKKWEHGFSFIYDEKQESLVRRIEKVDPSSGATSPPTYEQDNSANPAHAPSVKLSIPYASDWNTRITGGVWYIRDVSGSLPSKWWAQIECDFVEGSGKILSSGKEFDCAFNPTTSEYNFDVDHENLLQPNQTDTYFSRTLVPEDDESITARFSTAVVVGRRVYIGNVQIIKNDGSKEIKGDAMLKSPVNRFDTFPSKLIVEAAVNDGESITALEEFADRILQFKEQTLYIINVSQDIEFLEDVHKHKGVLLPAAVCKTDYGCAWVNRLGCYLYDGRKVIDLLEKGGRQIIKESDWFSFTTDNSIIGYIPKKRQLIVLKDCTATSVGDIFLYDMVTQSWVQGNSAITDSQIKSNFVNDVNGDLVWSHTSATGTMLKWADASAVKTGISFKTKDLDFGQPAQRKKIYKAYVSYKGDGGEITVNYGTDGNSTMAGTFYITGATGASTKANAADLCLYNASVGTNDWVLAELIPSSTINNIDSFRLSFAGDTDDAGFEINDISVVYRMKNIK